MQSRILKILCFCLLFAVFGGDNGVFCQFVGSYVFSTIKELEEALQNDPKLLEYFHQQAVTNPQETLSTTLTFGGNECPSTTTISATTSKDNSEQKDTTTAITKGKSTTAPQQHTTAAMTKAQSTMAPRPHTTTAATTKVQSNTSQDGWKHWPNESSNLTYKIFENKTKNYEDAKKICVANNGRLAAKLVREAKPDFWEALAQNDVKRYWIGLHDRQQEGIFVWSDGEDYNKTETRWSQGEPNDSAGEDCAEIWRENGMLNDNSCNTKKLFICERIVQT